MLARRCFLSLVSATGLSALLHACRSEDANESTAVVPASLPPTTDVDENSQTPGSPTAGAETATTPVTAPAGTVSIEQIMRMSQVLTAFPDLNDTTNGGTYLTALSAQPELGPALPVLWEQDGFAVTDPTGHTHDHSNLYLAGSGLFPTTATANPTLTIAALALMSADAIQQELGG